MYFKLDSWPNSHQHPVFWMSGSLRIHNLRFIQWSRFKIKRSACSIWRIHHVHPRVQVGFVCFNCSIIQRESFVSKLIDENVYIHTMRNQGNAYQPKSTTLTCVLVRMVDLKLIHHVPLLTKSRDQRVSTSRRHSVNMIYSVTNSNLSCSIPIVNHGVLSPTLKC